MLSSVSITRHVSEVTPPKQTREEKAPTQDSFKVKDVKKRGEKHNKRNPRLLRIKRKQSDMTFQQQRQFSSLLAGVQTSLLRNSASFEKKIIDSSQLRQEEQFMLNMILCDKYLFTKELKEQVRNQINASSVNFDVDVDSNLLNKVITSQDILPSLLTLLGMCRSHDYTKNIESNA